MSEPPEELFRRWVHIAEEDEAGIRVYRPFEDPLSLGRGRDSIEFHPDGSVIRYEHSATDAPRAIDGRWRSPKLDEIYTSGAPDELELSYRIVSVGPGELRMRLMED
ncbi:hypothetical protein L0U85_17845 [Glycomyces sp. L485]|uniref:hypothetical protein n=1 Tax=Glycomyces sp. L485 TaxID=2909235 RepID=UPI001F4A12F1|nr:hypothetical protein [Glycomyces sp. L485]MCH7232700.1 hypothetical protein [Glycomyces sp. L485]